MAEKIGWDQYEIALLIEACEKVLSGKEEKKVLVKDLSVALRQRAMNDGIEIDDIFRNENGITLQMTKMIYLLTEGAQGLCGASKDYSKMVQIRKNEQKRFQTILSEAHKQIEAKDTIIMDNKETFAEWLQNVPLEKYNQKSVIDALEKGSQYCNAHGLCKDSFWIIDDKNTFSLITSKLLSMRIYRIMHRNTALALEIAVPLYREYLAEKEKKKELPSIISPKLENAKWSITTMINNNNASNIDDPIYNSLNRVIDFLWTKYSVQLAFDRTGDGSNPHNELLYKVYNDANKEIMWVYYTCDSKAHYISIETEPEYISTVNVDAFDSVIKRTSHPCTRLIFTDFDRISNTLYDLCHSMDIYFRRAAVTGGDSNRVRITQKLLSISKIFDDPSGISVDKIVSMLGTDVDSAVITDILNEVKWATRIGEGLYSFAKKPVVHIFHTPSEGYTSDSGFDNYLNSVWNIADATRRSYVSAIRTAEKYAREHHCENYRMYDCSFAEAIATMLDLRNNQGFLEFNRQQHNRFSAAFSRFETYTGFTKIAPINKNIEDNINVTEEEKEKYIRALMQRYQSGMQFDSIDFDNFRDCYDSLFDEKIDSDDATLEKKLRQCGVFYNDRLFPADGIIDKATGEKLLDYLENAFASGKSVIYYKAIMTDMADDFAYCFSLTDEKMLRAYIEYSVPKNTYYFEKDYMSNDRFVKIDHSSEITDYMLSVGKPLSYEEIYAELSHISADVIRSEIHTNKMFVMDSKEHYFHIDIFECDDSELDKISEIINGDIEENGYAIWTHVFGEIQDRMPIFIENNPYLGSIGIRNAVSRRLSDKFNFDGAIISSISKQLSMADVYKLYAKRHPTFTAEEIYNFSKELDTVIYFNALYEVCIRVSETLFVSRDSISIDVDAVDAAIGTYFSGNYMLVKDIDSFLVFPNVGYEWNQFLLEGFLLSYSKKYMLLNNGNSLNNVAGAIVKRNIKNIEFVDICADVLANSDIALTKTKALDYLAEMNLITRRSYRDVDRAITLANQTRNRKR